MVVVATIFMANIQYDVWKHLRLILSSFPFLMLKANLSVSQHQHEANNGKQLSGYKEVGPQTHEFG